jgi:hypothetical protein
MIINHKEIIHNNNNYNNYNNYNNNNNNNIELVHPINKELIPIISNLGMVINKKS